MKQRNIMELIMNKFLSFILLSSATLSTSLLAVNLHTCTECHGKKFEKPAMGISRIVKDLNKEELTTALNGYKTNQHGGAMQEVMNRQISKFSDAEIEEIVVQILDDNITNIAMEKNDKKSDENSSSSELEVDLSTCLSCHGESFEKHSFGFSRIVAEMSKEDIKASLHGYKNDIYGGQKKALMVNQVINFSDEELDIIAEEIFKNYHYE